MQKEIVRTTMWKAGGRSTNDGWQHNEMNTSAPCFVHVICSPVTIGNRVRPSVGWYLIAHKLRLSQKKLWCCQLDDAIVLSKSQAILRFHEKQP